ncbi:hypothetical protein J2728_000560 [Caulobacter segnis]|nr:hypothetical protein [Caulobacter segnis]
MSFRWPCRAAERRVGANAPPGRRPAYMSQSLFVGLGLFSPDPTGSPPFRRTPQRIGEDSYLMLQS